MPSTELPVKPVLPLVEDGLLSAMAHITGGGFPDNIPRVLPKGLDAVVRPAAWTWPPLFRFLEEKGSIPRAEMLRVFNCGIGMVLIVPAARAAEVRAPPRRRRRAIVRDRPDRARTRRRPVRVRRAGLGVSDVPFGAPTPFVSLPARLAVFLSGRGSNFLALAEACAAGSIPAEIALVASDRADAPGLARAREMGLFGVALSAKELGGREGLERRLVEIVAERRIDLVCLAGFMRILSPEFVGRFPRRILNIHPSLLPSFPGLHAQEQAVRYGVRVSGVTVHFVDEGTDTGPVVDQRAVPVLPGDDADALAARILPVEHELYASAVARVLRGGWRVEGRVVRFP